MQHAINPDFIAWLLQYFTPSAIVTIMVALYTWKSLLVVLDIVRELKKRENPPPND